MIINDKKTTVAYRCPFCGSGVMSVVGVFALSGDIIKLKCPCGKSEMSITKLQDDKINLSVPCIICPSNHSFTVKKNIFFSDDILSFACSYSGIDVCFIGKEENVKKALDENEKILLEILGEENTDIITEFKKHNATYFDSHTADIVKFILGELYEDNKIFCRCTENGEKGDYEIEENESGITIRCKKCRAEKVFDCSDSISLHAFADADDITLD